MTLDLTMLMVLSSIVTALVQVVRQVPWLSARTWALPAVSLIFGIIAAFVWIMACPPAMPAARLVFYCLAHGMMSGLSACGLYSLAGRPAIEAATKLANSGGSNG